MALRDIEAREPRSHATPKLRRVLKLGPLILYGMGVIIGAGIYAALGSVVAVAGAAAPVSFLLAGLSACLTGLCYAKLSARYPEASGAAAFVGRGFRSPPLGTITGMAILVSSALAAAFIAWGAVHYLTLLMPLPPSTLVVGLVVAVTVLSFTGVKTSVGFAAVIGAMEILGLVAATIVGFVVAPDLDLHAVVPPTWSGWRSAVAGAFIAFFAFIGFETLANMAEEVEAPTKNVPRGIIGAVGAALVLYVGVALAVVLAERGGGNPLLALFEGRSRIGFAVIGFLSVANGVLVEIIMLSRLLYGMADKGPLPKVFAQVDAATQTPINATIMAGCLALTAALAMPIERLLALSDGLTLAIFFTVDLALCLIHWREPVGPPTFGVSRAVPPVAALLTGSMLIAGVLGPGIHLTHEGAIAEASNPAMARSLIGQSVIADHKARDGTAVDP